MNNLSGFQAASWFLTSIGISSFDPGTEFKLVIVTFFPLTSMFQSKNAKVFTKYQAGHITQVDVCDVNARVVAGHIYHCF